MNPAPTTFRSHRSPVLGTRGMVASSQPLATAAGLRVLSEGGGAADAAVATAAALNVTEPNMTGIGGDCFSLYYDAESHSVTALNGSGRAPAGLSLDLLEEQGLLAELPPHHAHNVTVPGACAGWCDMIERFGRLSLERVLAPAVELAERGFPVAPVTARLWQAGAKMQLARSPGGRELTIDGRGPEPGELFRNPGLARTFRCVAEKGKSGFYTGEIAGSVAALVREHGGIMNEADLAEHHSTWEEPISTLYRGLRIHECPPNGQGLTALLALGLLRGFDVAEQEPLSTQRLHLMIECMRLAFADARRYVADPAQVAVPVEALLDEAYLSERRSGIDPRRANPDAGFGRPLGGSDTVYLCAVDASGNACSFINSNYQGFGTGLVPEGFGFSLQNRGFNFTRERGHANALGPRKRPYHTIIPGLATREDDGSLYGPFGVMGGFMQPQGHLQVVVAMADDDADPQAALDRPRFSLVAGRPGDPLDIEAGIPDEVMAELAERGHELRRVDGFARHVRFGRGQIIRRDPSGALWGGSDPRADGCAMSL